MPSNSVIANEYVNKTKDEVEQDLGKPDKEITGYVSIGLKPEPEDVDTISTWYYRTTRSHLYIWFSGDICFESLYFDDGVIF